VGAILVTLLAVTVVYGVLKLRAMQALYDKHCPPRLGKHHGDELEAAASHRADVLRPRGTPLGRDAQAAEALQRCGELLAFDAPGRHAAVVAQQLHLAGVRGREHGLRP
jgi:hypothetical protein